MIGAQSLAAEVKVLMFVMISLVAIFLIVIIKIIKDANLSVTQKWILSLVTPLSIMFGFFITKLTRQRDVVLFTFLILIIANLSYISKSITNFLVSEFIYDGNNGAIRNGLFVALSLLIIITGLAGAFTMFVFLVKT